MMVFYELVQEGMETKRVFLVDLEVVEVALQVTMVDHLEQVFLDKGIMEVLLSIAITTKAAVVVVLVDLVVTARR